MHRLFPRGIEASLQVEMLLTLPDSAVLQNVIQFRRQLAPGSSPSPLSPSRQGCWTRVCPSEPGHGWWVLDQGDGFPRLHPPAVPTCQWRELLMSLNISDASASSMEASARQVEGRRDMGPATQGKALSESCDSHMNGFQMYKVSYYQWKSSCSGTPGRKLASPVKKHGGTCTSDCIAEDGTLTFLLIEWRCCHQKPGPGGWEDLRGWWRFGSSQCCRGAGLCRACRARK